MSGDRRGSIDKYVQSMRVVPGYSDLFGVAGSYEQLLEIVRRHSLHEWLSLTSRIQCMLSGHFHLSQERHGRVLHGLTSPAMRERWSAFEKKCGHGLVAVSPAQVSCLQQIAIQHATNDADEDKPWDDASLDDFWTGVLITWDLMHEVPPDLKDEGFLPLVIQEHARRPTEGPNVLLSRAYHMYEIGKSQQTGPVATLASLFCQATGVSLLDYLKGGLIVSTFEDSRSPEEIAERWMVTPTPDDIDHHPAKECVKLFHSIRCADLSVIRGEISKCDGDRHPRDFSFSATTRYPIADVGRRGRFVINLRGLHASFFNGVYDTIRTEVEQSRLPGYDVRRVGGVWGEVFEGYVLEILQACFGNRFIKLARCAGPRADCLIIYPDAVIVCEIKSSPIASADHKSLLTMKARGEEIRKVAEKALSQIACTIRDLRAGAVDLDSPCNWDWTITPLIPVVITQDDMPLLPAVWPYYEHLMGPLRGLPMQDQILKPRFLSVHDVESLPDVVSGNDLSKLLRVWAHDPVSYECPFGHFLSTAGLRRDGSFVQSRFEEATRYLAAELGITPGEWGAEE